MKYLLMLGFGSLLALAGCGGDSSPAGMQHDNLATCTAGLNQSFIEYVILADGSLQLTTTGTPPVVLTRDATQKNATGVVGLWSFPDSPSVAGLSVKAQMDIASTLVTLIADCAYEGRTATAMASARAVVEATSITIVEDSENSYRF